MSGIPWLDASDPESPFPPLERAFKRPSGLLAAGGDLSPTRLLRAYRSGIFPWYEEGQPILWWSPDPRAVLLPERIVISRSLRKTLRNTPCRVSFDQAFRSVVDACAEPRPGREHTWITAQMAQAYCELHRLGHAHSVEVWSDAGELLGGLYGVTIGGVFFGESMFSRSRDMSKIALIWLARHLQAWGFVLIDCQVPTEHLISMGAQLLPRRSFAEALEAACSMKPAADWQARPLLP